MAGSAQTPPKGRPTPTRREAMQRTAAPTGGDPRLLALMAVVAIVVVAVVVGVVQFRGGDGKKDTLTAPASNSDCTAAKVPTTDLKTKPVYTPGTCAAPTATTTTDVVVGTGAEAKAGDDVTVQYVGVNYKDGKQFDASWDSGNPFPFKIGEGVIPGFSKGVTGMKVGGRRLVVIPPNDGYGDQGPVPGGTLAFVIDLVKVG